MAENHHHTSENPIIAAIRSGDTKMRPRWYFVIQSILVVIAAVLILVLLILAISFIVFALEQNGGFFAASFGLTGWEILFLALPWSIILLSIALLLILIILLKRYEFIYQQPSLYVLLVLVVVIAIGSFFIEAVNFHTRIEENNIPVLENIYHYETTPQNYIYRGMIVQFLNNGFVLENTAGQTSTFLVPPGVTLNLTLFKLGQYVMVFGEPGASDTVNMYGIESGGKE